MSHSDREHFEEYREQTRVKHEILSAYLPAFYHILKRRNKNLLYVDAFAGRGTYSNQANGEEVDGSPLRALRLIANNDDFAEKVTVVFIEPDDELFANLESVVARFYGENPHIRKPHLVHGEFASAIDDLLQRLGKERLAPCFLFVDPCGVQGVSFDAIQRTMDASDSCELFMFFNIDGVRRIAGLEYVSPILIDLYGDRESAEKLHERLRETADTLEREELILGAFRAALMKRMQVDYVVPFRVEYEGRQATSHYFIYATRHHLGFSIMKDVMWKRGLSGEGESGLEFVQASRPDSGLLIRHKWEEFKESILSDLRDGKRPVHHFYEERVRRPDDLFCEAAYRAALLELEEVGRIQVLNKLGENPAGPDVRPKRKGKATLGRDYWVRIQ